MTQVAWENLQLTTVQFLSRVRSLKKHMIKYVCMCRDVRDVTCSAQ